MMLIKNLIFTTIAILLLFCISPTWAEDVPETRLSLKNLPGVAVFVEELQTNIQKYGKKAGLERALIQAEVEQSLKKQGITVLSYNDWLNTKGRPFLYVNINTHETERYWYAYDIKVEVKQIAILEANPQVKTMVATWGISLTGIANIGNLHNIKKDAMVLVQRFVDAYKTVNRGK